VGDETPSSDKLKTEADGGVGRGRGRPPHLAEFFNRVLGYETKLMSKIVLILLASAPLFAQLESHTLAISATRTITPQPDQVVFGLTVSSPASASLDQIVAALSGLGITDANLTGIGNLVPFQWGFNLVAPLSKLSTTIGAIVKLEETIGQNNSGLALTYTVEGTQVSGQLLQSQSCSNTDLMADATAQAEKLVAAAGLTLGPILRVSNVPVAQSGAIPTNVQHEITFLSGSFSDFLLGSPTTSPVTCSLLVKFKLLP
jgi:hypothetical protein